MQCWGCILGIKLDRRADTGRFTLNKVHDAYLANERFVNCLAMPPEWMEIVDPVYCVDEERSRRF